MQSPLCDEHAPRTSSFKEEGSGESSAPLPLTDDGAVGAKHERVLDEIAAERTRQPQLCIRPHSVEGDSLGIDPAWCEFDAGSRRARPLAGDESEASLTPFGAIDERVGDATDRSEVVWRDGHAEFLCHFANSGVNGRLPRFEFAASTDEFARSQTREFFTEQDFGAGAEECPAASHQIDHAHVVHISHRTPSTTVVWGLSPSR